MPYYQTQYYTPQQSYTPQPSYNQFPYQQQPQPIPQPAMMVGRVVNDVTDIRPNETPTTGQPAVFPKADGSVVYLTVMDNTGRIVTREYVPKEDPVDASSSNTDIFTNMQEQLNRIEGMLSRRNNQNQGKKGDT